MLDRITKQVRLMKCDECGLPNSACNAMAMYRWAVREYKRGDIKEAEEYVKLADKYEDEYKEAFNDIAR